MQIPRDNARYALLAVAALCVLGHGTVFAQSSSPSIASGTAALSIDTVGNIPTVPFCVSFPVGTEPLPFFRTLRDWVERYVTTREWSCAQRPTSTLQGYIEDKGKEIREGIWATIKAKVWAWGAELGSKIKAKTGSP